MAKGTERQTVDAPVAFQMLGISRNSGYSLIQKNEFPVPVIRAGKRILISKAAIDRLLQGETIIKQGEAN
jgi:predicted DNA-binding transcriptional regulator AlpA